MRGLENCKKNDIILISDVDEIVRKEKIQEVALFVEQTKTPCRVQQTLYRFFFNCFEYKGSWEGTVGISFKKLCESTPDSVRLSRGPSHFPIIDQGGWHFTSMGGMDNFKYKIESYSHSEHDNERLKSIDYVNGFIKNSCVIVEVDDTFPSHSRWEWLNIFFTKKKEG